MAFPLQTSLKYLIHDYNVESKSKKKVNEKISID